MVLLARVVLPGVAHHVTQRGNRRQQNFFGKADYALHCNQLAESCSTRALSKAAVLC
jgi:putative transposase